MCIVNRLNMEQPSENQTYSSQALHPIGNFEVLYKKGLGITT